MTGMLSALLSDEDHLFAAELRAWLAENYEPGLSSREWHQRLAAGGWLVPSWPRRWGGREATLTQEIVYNEELGRVDAPVSVNAIAISNIGPMLMQHGTSEQQEHYLPRMVSCEQVWCQGFSEPNAGSDLASLQTRAEDHGDIWLVNGQKTWNTFGHEADLCLALCRTDPEVPKHRGISALIVDMHHPGVEVRPLRDLTGDTGFNEIFFTDVEVPKSDIVGPANDGWKVAMTTLLHERLGTMKLGIQLRRRLDHLLDLVRTSGHIDNPITRRALASAAVQVEMMEFLTVDALTAVVRGQDPGANLPLGKLQWSYLMQELAELGLRLQGPAAVLYRDPRNEGEGDWQHQCLAARSTTIGAGTTEIQKNIIAQRVLGMPRGT